jgi:hypothetical protein
MRRRRRPRGRLAAAVYPQLASTAWPKATTLLYAERLAIRLQLLREPLPRA